MKKLLSKNDLLDEIANASDDELSYLKGRYCGPHNIIMASKKYDYRACDLITKLVEEELFRRQLENLLIEEMLSND